MAKEIERKFLVAGSEYMAMAESSREIAQGYLSADPCSTVRVRISGTDAWLTVKGKNSGAVRDEWEYAIPVDDARRMLALCHGIVVEKTRYIVPFAGHRWEVDVFKGIHEGLVVAEVELPSADTPVELPPFVGEEVTGDARYYNSSLSKAGFHDNHDNHDLHDNHDNHDNHENHENHDNHDNHDSQDNT